MNCLSRRSFSEGGSSWNHDLSFCAMIRQGLCYSSAWVLVPVSGVLFFQKTQKINPVPIPHVPIPQIILTFPARWAQLDLFVLCEYPVFKAYDSDSLDQQLSRIYWHGQLLTISKTQIYADRTISFGNCSTISSSSETWIAILIFKLSALALSIFFLNWNELWFPLCLNLLKRWGFNGETPQDLPALLLTERCCFVRGLMCCPSDWVSLFLEKLQTTGTKNEMFPMCLW